MNRGTHVIRKTNTIIAAWVLALVVGAIPAIAQAARPGFEDDVRALGSADYAARQSAMRRLWWAGPMALAALKSAEKSGNPEASLRAARLIADIDDGIYPSTPATQKQLLQQYRGANQKQRIDMISQFETGQVDSFRLLLRLRDRARDPLERQAIDAALAHQPLVVERLLLSQGRIADAEAYLADQVGKEVSGMDDYVGYWQSRGKVRERIADLASASTSKSLRLRALLERAEGQSAAALRDAHAANEPLLVERLTIEQGDWPALQHLLAASKTNAIADFELRAFVADLAGDPAEAQALGQRLANGEFDKPKPDQGEISPREMSAALCAVDRPDDAERYLQDKGTGEDRFNLMMARLEIPQMLKLFAHTAGTSADAEQVQGRGARLLWMLGDADGAAKMLEKGTRTDRSAHDEWAELVLANAAREQHKLVQSDALLVEALKRNNFADLEGVGIPHGPEMIEWWMYLGTTEPHAAALADVRAIATGAMPVEKLQALADAFEQWAPQYESTPNRTQHAIVTAWLAANRLDLATADAQRYADGGDDADAFVDLGDCLTGEQHWPAAADAYEQAALIDPTNPLTLMQQGWSLLRAGEKGAGRSAIERSHVLALGNMYARMQLMDFARQHDLPTDADRERTTLLALGDSDDLSVLRLRQTLGDEAEDRQDYAASALNWEVSYIAIIRDQFTFADPTADVAIPARLHRLRTMADLAAGRPDAAMAQAALWVRDCPFDPDGIAAVVRLADAHGYVRQADGIFRIATADYVKATADYPRSVSLQNALAWSEARARRNLDDALAHARCAAELAPQNTAILDTLAETYYQRREFQNAINTIKECIKLQPNEPHHRTQLARFKLALKTGAVDNE